MNNSAQSSFITIVAEHPYPGGECALIAPQPETGTRKAVGRNSNARVSSLLPSIAGQAGGVAASLPRQRQNSQPLNNAPRIFSALGAAVAANAPISLLKLPRLDRLSPSRGLFQPLSCLRLMGAAMSAAGLRPSLARKLSAGAPVRTPAKMRKDFASPALDLCTALHATWRACGPAVFSAIAVSGVRG